VGFHLSLTGLSLTLHQKATEWTWKNPTLAACSIAAAGGAALIVAPGAFSTIILNAVGFTGAGVQSGKFQRPS
jgi:hypothetical protein